MAVRLPRIGYKNVLTWLILMAGGLVFLTTGITRQSLWHEEAYTAAVVKNSFFSIWDLAGSGGQPPLYYLVLKLFCLAFGYSEFSLRFLSVLGVLALAALGAGPVKRIFGKKVGIVFALIVIVTPINLSLAHEAKMYTWAMFFTTGSCLYGYLAATEGRRGDWVRFSVFLLAALYTYNFAIIPIIITNYMVLRWVLAKNRNMIREYMAAVAAVILLFLPWAVYYFGDMLYTVNSFGDYNIFPPEATYAILRAVLITFGSKFSFEMLIEIPVFLLASFAILWSLFQAFLYRRKEGIMIVFGLLVYSLTLVMGAVSTYIIFPVMLQRISMPVTGLFLIAVAYGVSHINYRHYIAAVCCLFILLSLLQNMNPSVNNLSEPIREVRDYISKNVAPGDAVVHFNHDTYSLFLYYFPQYKNILYLGNGNTANGYYDAFYPSTIASWNSIGGLTRENKNLWLINHPGSFGHLKQISLVNLGILNGVEKTHRIFSNFYLFDYSIRKAETGEGKIRSIPKTGTVKIKVKTFDNNSGQAVVKLFNKDGSFITGKKINEKNVFSTMTGKIDRLETEVVFENVPYGNYAAFAFHDENNNKKLDFKENYFLKEGFGMTNGFGRGWLFFSPGMFFVESELTEKEITLIYPR